MRMYPVLISIITTLAIGCGNHDPQSAPPPSTSSPAPSSGAKAQATTLFAQRCVPCHGSTGKGDGVASASLNPKPRAFGDGAWQKSVTDDHIMKIIKFGGASVGKSPAMPNNPDLNDPEVVAGLKDVVRSFKKP
jgi:mono/diheme cytochrome c family protein